MFFLGALSAEAANHCVRSTATGNGSGSDWTNAYTAIPATLVRGDTYYIADGSYGSYLFNTAVSGTLTITIKKATVADHGTATGWSDSYGDGQAVFGNSRYIQSYWNFAGVVFASGYWIFDGATGAGSNPTSYGFSFATDTSGANENYVVISAGQSYTFNGMVIKHAAITCSGLSTHSEMGILGDTQANVVSPLIQYNYIDNCQVNMYTHGSYWTVDHNYFGRTWSGSSTSGLHGVPIQNGYALGNTFSNNTITKCTYICIEEGGSGSLGGTKVYNNIFNPNFDTPEGIVSGSGGYAAINDTIYGNTIINSTATILLQDSGSSSGSGNIVKNNLFYNSNGGPSTATNIDVGYNAYFLSSGYYASQPGIQVSSGNPFVNLSSGDYRLAVATATGVTLSSPYNVDILGNARGADGTWDRGAYEFVGSTSPLIYPNPPNSLH